jgi:hypothetical protein
MAFICASSFNTRASVVFMAVLLVGLRETSLGPKPSVSALPGGYLIGMPASARHRSAADPSPRPSMPRSNTPGQLDAPWRAGKLLTVRDSDRPENCEPFAETGNRYQSRHSKPFGKTPDGQ